MDVDAAPAAAHQTPLDLPVLATIRAARARHGLRTNDYGRYRCVLETGKRGVRGYQTHPLPARRSLFFFFLVASRALSLSHRSYCTKKLRRLYRNLKLSHGRGKYQKRPLDAETVTEDG